MSMIKKTPRYTLSPLAIILLFFIVFVALIAISQWGLWDNNRTQSSSGDEDVSALAQQGAEAGSDMMLQITRPGQGATPAPGDKVSIYFTAWLPNQSEPVIQTGRTPEEAVSFILGENNIIEGIENTVQVLRPGGQALVFVPARYAYKEAGNDLVPPNTDLVFLIDLVSIEK